MLTETAQERIRQIIETNFPEVFIVEMKFIPGTKNRLSLKVDTDQGISLSECSEVSRSLGRTIEEEELINTAYHLEVSSPGIGHPLQLHRQYVQNIGRNLQVLLGDGKEVKGMIKEVADTQLTLEPLSMKGMKPGKKRDKNALADELVIEFSTIKEAKVFI